MTDFDTSDLDPRADLTPPRADSDAYADLARVVALRVSAKTVEDVLRPDVLARMRRTLQEDGYAPTVKFPWGTVALTGWEPQPTVVDEGALMEHVGESHPEHIELIPPARALTVFDPEPREGSIVLVMRPTNIEVGFRGADGAWSVGLGRYAWIDLVTVADTAKPTKTVHLLWQPATQITPAYRAELLARLKVVDVQGQPSIVVDSSTGEQVPGVIPRSTPQVRVNQPGKKIGAPKPGDSRTVADVEHYARAAQVDLTSEHSSHLLWVTGCSVCEAESAAYLLEEQ